MSNFFSSLQTVMRESSDRIFLDLQDHPSITYGEADRLSAKVANRLLDFGLGAEDRITVQVEKSPQTVILYLACLRSGIIFHPLNTAYMLNELDHFLNDAQPALVVCDSSRFQEISALANRCGIKHVHTLDADGSGTLWSGVDNCDDQFEVVAREQDDVALLIYTSGTTGKPKGAMITHRNISTNTASLVDIWDWSEKDVLLHVLPLFHVHGLCLGLHCPMLCGARVLFQSKFSVSQSLKLIPQSSVMMGIPTIYTRLLSDERLSKELCKKFRLFISGSAPLLAETSDEFWQRTSHRILERYGMSETQMITSNPLHGDRKRGSVGLALPDVCLRVCDESGVQLGCGEIGTLEIKGPNLFKGYWRNESATKSAFRADGYFATGDLATIDEQGVVTIVGRKSDMIISAGFNVYPKEVEVQLNRIAGITDSAVFGVPHSDLGEAIVATVVQQQGGATEGEIFAQLKDNLSAFKIPQQLIFVEELPKNAMGKIEKKQLRQKYQYISDSS